MRTAVLAWLAAAVVVLSALITPWAGLDRATASRFLPTALEVSLGGVCLFALLRNRKAVPGVEARRPGSRNGPAGQRSQKRAAPRVASRAAQRVARAPVTPPAPAPVTPPDLRARVTRLAPWLGVAFVAWLFLTSLTADRPSLAFLGLYDWGTGALFSAGLVGAWALGRAPGRSKVRLVEDALIIVVLANAVEAVVQAFGVHLLGVAPFGARADGFLRNPVYLSALIVGGWWLVASRFGTTRRWWWAGCAGLIGAAVQASGSREGLVLLIVAAVASLAVLGWRGAAIVAAATVVGVLAVAVPGPSISATAASSTGTARLASGEGGYAGRIDNLPRRASRHCRQSDPGCRTGPLPSGDDAVPDPTRGRRVRR